MFRQGWLPAPCTELHWELLSLAHLSMPSTPFPPLAPLHLPLSHVTSLHSPTCTLNRLVCLTLALAHSQSHTHAQIALLTTKLTAAEARLERLTAELQRRPAASAVAAMAEQLSALAALTGRQLEAEGWGSDEAMAAVAAVAADPQEQLQPAIKVGVWCGGGSGRGGVS